MSSTLRKRLSCCVAANEAKCTLSDPFRGGHRNRLARRAGMVRDLLIRDGIPIMLPEEARHPGLRWTCAREPKRHDGKSAVDYS